MLIVLLKVIGHLSGHFSSASTARGTIAQGKIEGWESSVKVIKKLKEVKVTPDSVLSDF